MTDPQRRPDPDTNPPRDTNEGQEIHLKFDEHGHGRPGLNQAAEEELEKTAEPDEEHTGEPRR
jgi:hypothetical protein